jgi:hypothetical protein
VEEEMSIEAIKQALDALEEYQAKGPPFMSCDAAVAALRAAIEQGEKQKPVAWMYDFLNSGNRDDVIRNWVTQSQDDITRENGFNVRPLYTAPRQWVGLTEADIRSIDTSEFWDDHTPMDFARVIESKLKELNT